MLPHICLTGRPSRENGGTAGAYTPAWKTNQKGGCEGGRNAPRLLICSLSKTDGFGGFRALGAFADGRLLATPSHRGAGFQK